MQYDFVPMPDRKPLKWPNGARIAVMLCLNLEYWDLVKDTDEPYYPGGPSILPDPLPGNIADLPNYSWREYGQRVGIWRLMDIFDKAGVPATCTMNAKMGLERRRVVDAVNERGWEIVAHNYVQTELLTDYAKDIEKEREIIQATLRVYQDVVGKPAKGWLSSSLRCTENTTDILAEEGMIFHTDIMNDDQPYLIQTPTGPIVSVPYSNEVNDFQIFLRRGNTTSQAAEVIIEQFDELYREGAESGRLMNIGIHPHVWGQPFRVRALREFLEHVSKYDGVWFAKREEIAEWYLENHESHIS
jgi:allantoinase